MKFLPRKLHRTTLGLIRKDTRPLLRFLAQVQKKAPVWNEREVTILQMHHQLIEGLRFEDEARQFLQVTGIEPWKPEKT